MRDSKNVQDLTNEEFDAIITETINQEVYNTAVETTEKFSFIR